MRGGKTYKHWGKENYKIESSQCTVYNQNRIGIVTELQDRCTGKGEMRSDEHITQI